MRNPSATTIALLALTGTLTAGAILAQTAKTTPRRAGPRRPHPDRAAVQQGRRPRVRPDPPARVPKGGYVSISIDGRFVTAQALPDNPRDPVYIWDTKAPYAPTDSPDTLRTYNDGPHALTLAVYEGLRGSRLIGQDTVSVQLANKISLPSGQGITMAYPWKTSRDLRYQRRTDLTAAATDAAPTTAPPPIQESRLRFTRSVENADGGEYLIRDEIIPVDRSAKPKPFVSYVATRGSVTPVGTVRALYRTVDARGRVLSDLPSQNRAMPSASPSPCCRRAASPSAHTGKRRSNSLWTGPRPRPRP